MEKLTKNEQKLLRRQERFELEKKESGQKLLRQVMLWIGIFAFIIFSVWGLIQLSNSSSVLSSATNIPALSKDDLTFGNPKAKAVLIEYSDFQCPACAAYLPLVEQVLSQYDGKILFVYRFFPLTSNHKYSLISTQAAYAAHLQGKFLEMHNMLLKNQTQWSESENPKQIFISYAQSLNLDPVKFVKDMEAESTVKIVKNQESSSIASGLTHTPTFFLNGKEIAPKSLDEFKKLIDQELNK